MYLAIRKKSIHWRIHAKLSITCKCFQIHEIYMRSKCLKKLHQKSRLHITPSVAILLCRLCKNFLLALVLFLRLSLYDNATRVSSPDIHDDLHTAWPLTSDFRDVNHTSWRVSHASVVVVSAVWQTDRQTNRESCSSDALASVWVCQTQQRSASCCMTHLNDESRTQRATDKSNLHTPLRPPVRTWIELTT